MAIDDSFTRTATRSAPVHVTVAATVPTGPVTGFVIGTTDDPPADAGVSREQLAAAGFTGKAGACHIASTDGGRVTVAVGFDGRTIDSLRDAAATFARAAAHRAELAVVLPAWSGVAVGAASTPSTTA